MGRMRNSETTPIVHVTAVQDYEAAGQVAVVTADEEEDEHVVPLTTVQTDGELDSTVVAPQWQDVPFALLFLIHLAVMVWLSISVAPKGFQNFHIDMDYFQQEMQKSDDVTDDDMREFNLFLDQVAAFMQVYPERIGICMVIPCCVASFLYGLFGTGALLKPCPKTMIYICLSLSLAWTALLLIGAAISTGWIFLMVLSGVALLSVAYYIRAAWKMVPFAGINLKISLEGIGRNCGIFLVAFFFSQVGFLWVVYWFYVVVGTLVFQNSKCHAEHPDLDSDVDSDNYSNVCDPSMYTLLFFLLSLYWTSAIVMNTMHVCVAGVMATWCLDKSEADSCCSSAILGSLYRSMTFSFGSICLGSLLQGLVAVFRFLIDSARAQRQQDPDTNDACGSILLCILDCIADLLEELIRAFNQWAYIFVGLYGYSYVESGKRVMELFRARGFTAIITDNLVSYVLAFTTFLIALATAFTAWLLEYSLSPVESKGPIKESDSFFFGSLPHPGAWAAFIGFIIGLWVASVMTNVIKGAVNTLIVCWADSPNAMEAQHPDLTRELSSTWRHAFVFLNEAMPEPELHRNTGSAIV